jgi:hypothetical protein
MYCRCGNVRIDKNRDILTNYCRTEAISQLAGSSKCILKAHYLQMLLHTARLMWRWDLSGGEAAGGYGRLKHTTMAESQSESNSVQSSEFTVQSSDSTSGICVPSIPRTSDQQEQ